MSFWTYQNLADVTNGHWLVEPDDPIAEVAGLWHDTREIKPGQAYLAIKGDNFDGHDFLDQAFDAGAQLAIVSTEPATSHQPPAPVLKVDDTVKALQDLARAYRDELKTGCCKVIGIAGSNGKTTTRHLIHHVLTHAGLTGTQSPKSFNNHLGVPLTLLQAKPTDDFVAAEIGTNHPGEIDFLSAIARPDIAVITSIGEEHLEFFKDLNGVAEEESEILKHIIPGGVAMTPGLLNNDGLLPWNYLHKCREDVKVVRVSGHGRCEPTEEMHAADTAKLHKPPTNAWHYCVVLPHPTASLSGSRFQYWPWEDQGDLREAMSVTVPLPGIHNSFNAGYALLVAQHCGIDIETAIKALRFVDLPDQRMSICQLGNQRSGVVLIDDAYNANPSSTRAAIALMASLNATRTVLVFGDMLEIGEASQNAHQQVGIQAQSAGLDHLITIGTLAKYAGITVEKMSLNRFDKWSEDLPEQIAALLQPGDTVLLKASRGMRLERLIPAIERRFGPARDDEPT